MSCLGTMPLPRAITPSPAARSAWAPLSCSRTWPTRSLVPSRSPSKGWRGAQWNVYNENQNTPYVAVGGIVKKKVNGAIKWMAFVLEKIQFTTPGLNATTQGETIEWQTPTLSANILRSDAEGHPWYRDSTLFDTEAEAEKAVKAYLNITEPLPASAPGKTAVATAAKS